MPIVSEVITVATSATLVSSGGRTIDDMVGLAVFNAGANTIYLGGSTVTTAAGFPLAAGASATFDLGPSDLLYGIVAAATEPLRTLETRQ